MLNLKTGKSFQDACDGIHAVDTPKSLTRRSALKGLAAILAAGVSPSLCGSITRGLGYRNLAGRLAANGSSPSTPQPPVDSVHLWIEFGGTAGAYSIPCDVSQITKIVIYGQVTSHTHRKGVGVLMNPGGTNKYICYWNNASQVGFNAGTTGGNPDAFVQYMIDMSGCYADGVYRIASALPISSTFVTIGGLYGGNSYVWTGYIGRAYAFAGSSLIYDLVPATLNGEIGFYETVSGAFYKSGEMISAGPIVPYTPPT